MNKIFFTGGLLLLAISGYSQSAKQFAKAGQEFFKAHKYKDAIEQYTKAIDLAPRKTDYYVARSESYENIGQLQDAYDDIGRAMVFDNDIDLLIRAGKLSYKLKNYDKAHEHMDAALKRKSTDIDALEIKIRSYIAVQNFQKAQEYCKLALINKENAVNFYLSAVVLDNLGNFENAEWSYKKAISKDKKLEEAYEAYAELLIKMGKTEDAMEQCTKLMAINPNNTNAFQIRSKIFVKRLDFPSAINDISRAIIYKPEDEQLFLLRGTYYQQFTQYQNAINDYNKVLLLNKANIEALYQRANCYEQIADYKSAIKDYEALTGLSEYDMKARKLLDESKKRLFELNREKNAPIIKVLEPIANTNNTFDLPIGKNEFIVKGTVNDESAIETIDVNGQGVNFIKNEQGYGFYALVNVDSINNITISARDVYQNSQKISYSLNRTEINGPAISLTAPVSSDNGEIYLDSSNPNIYIEGKISDESPLKSILIEGVTASFKVDELNPAFSANIDVSNKNKITITAIDFYGNQTVKEFVLNRDAANQTENNPMGKTWVIFIENSNYQTFASLEGPVKDVSLMKSALAKYNINNIIHKKDMSKKELEKFFSIELRDLIRSNRVDALMVWYAGHGKFINSTGYWIPIDANREDEFTYFNINSLRASLQGYTNLKHLLIVTDACESGPTFYQAMRNAPQERDCSDWKATRFKSSQVFSSAGYEIAADDSQFTRTFASALANNPNSCIPIENIVQKVTVAVGKNNKQKPQFGKIAGLEDEDGTFFFIAK